MKLSETIRIECLQPAMRLGDKSEALLAVAACAARCPDLADTPTNDILRGLQEREALSTTGVGEGIAIPHCRLPGVKRFIVGLMTIPEGVDFDAVDGEKVRIIAFIIGPDSDTTEHPQILSGLSLRLSSDQRRKRLLAATTPEAMLDAMRLTPQGETAETAAGEKRLVQIVVQDEKLFDAALAAMESLDGAVSVVFESHNAREYMAKIPLFASFLVDRPARFSRVILTCVPRELTNEAVRRIEAATGPLADRRDILVIVQNTFFVAGSLDL